MAVQHGQWEDPWGRTRGYPEQREEHGLRPWKKCWHSWGLLRQGSGPSREQRRAVWLTQHMRLVSRKDPRCILLFRGKSL